jgi:flagellin
MRINNNIMAMNTHRQLKNSSTNQEKSIEKLSSGYRINKAGDDAAGLSISEKMRAQIRGLQQASRNSQDGISMLQTVEGALNETHSILQRMRELSVQAVNGTNVTADRDSIQKEISQLTKEVDRIASNTEFNTQKLMISGVSVNFQVGANSSQVISIAFGKMSSNALSIDTAAMNVGTSTDASAALGKINAAITAVSNERANIGAIQNRLEHTIKNLDVSAENLQASESRIRDVDMAQEMMEYTKNNILNQAGTAMLAQANQAPQAVLQLLK